MKLVEFVNGDGIHVGRIRGDEVVDLTAGGGPGELRSALADTTSLANLDGPATPLADTELVAPLARHGRVFAIGLNYEKTYPVGDTPPPRPKRPPWFSKLPGTLVGHGRPVVAPTADESFDYEAELAAVIGVGGRHIQAGSALEHVAGWTCFNDGSVRRWQRHSVNAGKNFDRSGSMGPWIVTSDEIDDPQSLRLTARVDGELRQDASTGEMIFSVAEIIEYLSTIIELRPGDVIATGSPEGTGGSFDPPRFLRAGQTVEVEIEGIGVLRNPVIAEDTP